MKETLIPLFIFLFFASALKYAVDTLLTKKKTVITYEPYIKSNLLTPTEMKFYNQIKDKVDENQYVIFTKVRLADIVCIKNGTQNNYSYFNRISSKHVDFVICNKETLEIKKVIELDDKSHARTERKERDKFVDGVLKKCGYDTVHIPVASSYNFDKIMTA